MSNYIVNYNYCRKSELYWHYYIQYIYLLLKGTESDFGLKLYIFKKEAIRKYS